MHNINLNHLVMVVEQSNSLCTDALEVHPLAEDECLVGVARYSNLALRWVSRDNSRRGESINYKMT
jgi:hypothetical protein